MWIKKFQEIYLIFYVHWKEKINADRMQSFRLNSIENSFEQTAF